MHLHRSPPESLVTVRALAETPNHSPSCSPPHSPRQPFSSREERESFTSVKEADCGIAQSFVSSHFSSLNQSDTNSNAVCDGCDDEDEDDNEEAVATDDEMMHDTRNVFCCAFGGWKQIELSGIQLSKSCGDLAHLSKKYPNGCDPSMGKLLELPALEAVMEERKEYPEIQQAGLSPIEKLPMEIFDHIIPLLAVDLPTSGCVARNTDLMSCLLTSRRFHAATLVTLYRRITVPSSYIFSKLLKHLLQYPALGTLVRRLDLSHLTPIGLGRTKRMNSQIQNLTADTLLRCLDLTPHLREFLVQEHLQDDLSEAVIRKVFCGLPVMNAVDFCAASSSSFRCAFEAIFNPQTPSLPSAFTIKRLSLHECNTLSASVFEVLLPKLPYLTHLDVCHTTITDSALMAIPKTARLTHLNISKCSRLKGPAVVEFLTTHPAVRDTLVYLNLLSNTASYRLLSRADVEKLLPLLPPTLRALNLSGAKIVREHIPLLIPLTRHVEEFGLGYSGLSMDDVNSLFITSAPSSECGSGSDKPDGNLTEQETINWTPHAVRYLDISGLPEIKPGTLSSANSCRLLSPAARPLEVLEIGDRLVEGLKERESLTKRLGWTVKELGRRGWYVRKPPTDQSHTENDSGRRPWKMGAAGWGMRKIPVACGDVGGLYGHYMFKK